MGSSNNPFSDLMELKKSPELNEADKYRKTGKKEQQRLLPKYGIPKEALAMPAENGSQPTPLNDLPNLLNGQQSPESENPFADLISKKKGDSLTDTIMGKLPPIKRGTFGQQGNPVSSPDIINQMIDIDGGAGGISAVGRGASSFGKGVKSLMATKNLNPKELVYGIQKGHDTLLKQSSDLYDFVKNEAPFRGVGKIELSEDLLKEAEAHLPKNRASKQLIERAKSGDYEALHELQSDLGKRGTKALGAETHADRNVGEEMLDTRGKINEAIRDRFKEYGHEDLAKLLDEASAKYRQLKETYYSHPTVSKLVHQESRKIPKNPLAVFSEESKPMGKVLAAHPEIKTALEHHENAAKFMKKLGKIPKVGLTLAGTGIVAGAPIYGAKKMLDLLLGD